MRIRDALSRHGPPEVDEDPWKSAPQAEGINQWQIDGLSQWIEEIKLEAHAVQIEAWAKEMGATTVQELLEHWEALAAALPLRPLEARRLQREGLKWLERPQCHAPAKVEETGKRITAKEGCHTRLAFAVAFSELTQMQAAKPAVLAMPAVPAVPAARRARLRQGTMNLSLVVGSRRGRTRCQDGGSNDFSHDSAADGLMTSDARTLQRAEFIESTERTHATRLPPHVIQATHAVHGYAGSTWEGNFPQIRRQVPAAERALQTRRFGWARRNGKALVSPCSTADLDALEELEELEASVEAVSKEVEEWRLSSFQGVLWILWIYLFRKGVPFICDPLGIFMDSQKLRAVGRTVSPASPRKAVAGDGSQDGGSGDFFCFVSQGKDPGPEREKELQPFIVQIFSALRWLHERYIAHCDISMENILVTKESDGRYQVKLIDFSMAVPGQRVTCGHRGKPSYQAPEMALSAFYDSFALDCFALGVVLFSSAARIYPWMSTVQGRCKCFDAGRE
ncbi:Serine/threonine-protein kinase MARK1 (MAP/microtubule affinity-regulating kinase 1) (PAR1 homolog c) (Par-1c) (Par1c) [Durusdinium trenchii]|uniref:Serine/threonine-protein kinase MARK1 (MAP/microtubule affinity-regulating kinase 1) (PAR1 homolog c) (Par-1c) (Par1c) n=1 Tax=Durusdinium trenchii TaxID=1381693 RepID=A0ABP0JGV7_9DINO